MRRHHRRQDDGAGRQREYYARTVHSYDSLRAHDLRYWQRASDWLLPQLPALGVTSVLDVGSGTGRAVKLISEAYPGFQVKGIEPSAELRAEGHRSGVPEDRLVDGDGTKIEMGDASVDLATAFGVLHHVARPHQVVAEMLRVTRRAIFIFDTNNFAGGSERARTAKQALDVLGLWPLANWINTRGKGYRVSEADGISYSYSVFTNFAQVQSACPDVFLATCSPTGRNPYRSATHVAVLGVKRD